MFYAYWKIDPDHKCKMVLKWISSHTMVKKKWPTNWRDISNVMLKKILDKILKYIKKNVINRTWDEYSTPFDTVKALRSVW